MGHFDSTGDPWLQAIGEHWSLGSHAKEKNPRYFQKSMLHACMGINVEWLGAAIERPADILGGGNKTLVVHGFAWGVLLALLFNSSRGSALRFYVGSRPEASNLQLRVVLSGPCHLQNKTVYSFLLAAVTASPKVCLLDTLDAFHLNSQSHEPPSFFLCTTLFITTTSKTPRTRSRWPSPAQPIPNFSLYTH